MTATVEWLVGFFEGEGSLRINKAGDRNLGIAHASVVSTDRYYVDEFQDRWPGHCKRVPARGRSREAWRWNLGARKVGAFLDDIDPFVVGERMHARMVVIRDFLALKASRNFRTAPDWYRERSFNLYLLMRELNARGPDGPSQGVIEAVLATCPDADEWRRR